MSTSGDINPDDPVDSVEGIGPARSETLVSAGYETIADLQEADLRELVRVLPSHVAQDVKDTVGNVEQVVTTVAEAKDRAQDRPGAIAKVVKRNGTQVPKVLEKVGERRESGATVEIHKG